MQTWMEIRLPGLDGAGWLAGAAVLGLALGSFLNVVLARLPAMLEYRWRLDGQPDGAAACAPPPGLAHPPSRCPHCATALRWRHNVPVLSWLWLRGRCAFCAAPIAARYPLVEAATGALCAGIAVLYGPTLLALALMGLAAMLLVLACFDLEHLLLPDCLTLPLLWAGLLANAAGMGLATPAQAIAGAAAGYALLAGVAWAFRRRTGRDGLGLGDAKLLAALGAWLGWQALPALLLAAGLWGVAAGLLARWRRRAALQPLGPGLAFGAALIVAGAGLMAR
ncbi:prepilin peptidase [Bordetella bronchiseptica]|uniref:prepilin peptidase n=5 Tax=Bordetella bronchiseptica TaxID=518 RepID=UPI0002F952ED|nr:A24 family peptidase [Bordetella bronchiseptica]KAK52454.1 type IV prepilin leader peptidase [Bordetella bronchiseptica OSU054]KAK69911.1 type IV prepilin leader peptidase [Bordetella bronchiseptica MO211]KAK77758.1 type IV prepilin leader peptidase [Bordetella bronchiseptica CA90 BB02]KDB73446.1 peptidase, A24 type IV prepilin peptidase family protein [Bordetella bronchiseptica CA90 BB1334]KDC20307.1 type IV prepilin leader peptidase [Bordetella bronchiseptica F-1]